VAAEQADSYRQGCIDFCKPLKLHFKKKGSGEYRVTDVKSGPALVEKAFIYMTNLSKECRKALTAKFGQAYKGISFDSLEPTMRREVEAWFAERDKNISIKHETSNTGRPGEILITYAGTTKDARFKFHVDGIFTTTGTSPTSPSYVKNINVTVDKREFTR
jgi:lysine/ornithine N-monooxygenase